MELLIKQVAQHTSISSSTSGTVSFELTDKYFWISICQLSEIQVLTNPTGDGRVELSGRLSSVLFPSVGRLCCVLTIGMIVRLVYKESDEERTEAS
jgi:hypothetical protein